MEDVRNLCSAIITQAMKDWKEGVDTCNTRLTDSVRIFFKSAWGKEVCRAVNISAKDALNRLENNKIDWRFI